MKDWLQGIYLYGFLYLGGKLFPYVAIYAPIDNVEAVTFAREEDYVDKVIALYE